MQTQVTYVAVPGRNRTLFHCVFWSHCCIRSAVTQNFHQGQSSYALCKHMSPALNKSSTQECFEPSNASEILNGIMFNFYPHINLDTIFNTATTCFLCIIITSFSAVQFRLPLRAMWYWTFLSHSSNMATRLERQAILNCSLWRMHIYCNVDIQHNHYRQTLETEPLQLYRLQLIWLPLLALIQASNHSKPSACTSSYLIKILSIIICMTLLCFAALSSLLENWRKHCSSSEEAVCWKAEAWMKGNW